MKLKVWSLQQLFPNENVTVDKLADIIKSQENYLVKLASHSRQGIC